MGWEPVETKIWREKIRPHRKRYGGKGYGGKRYGENNYGGKRYGGERIMAGKDIQPRTRAWQRRMNEGDEPLNIMKTKVYDNE